MTHSQDVESRVEHMIRWANGEMPPPLALTLGMTYACNLKCRFCAQRAMNREQPQSRILRELSEERLIRLVEEAGAMGVQKVHISGGGEPFLRPKTLSVMRAIKKQGMSGAITTNGTLVSDKMIRAMVEMEWDHITLSVDGPTVEIHDFLRDSLGSFDRVCGVAKSLRKWKEEFNVQMPVVCVHTVLTKENYGAAEQMVRLVHGFGAQMLVLIPAIAYHPEGEALQMRPEHREYFQSTVEKAKLLAEEYGISNNLDDFRDTSLVPASNDMVANSLTIRGEGGENDVSKNASDQRIKGREIIQAKFSRVLCYEPWTSLVIHPEGYLDPCEMVNETSHVGTRSLSEIWFQDGHLNTIRSRFLKGDIPPSCANCCAPLVAQNVRIHEQLSSKEVSEKR